MPVNEKPEKFPEQSQQQPGYVFLASEDAPYMTSRRYILTAENT